MYPEQITQLIGTETERSQRAADRHALLQAVDEQRQEVADRKRKTRGVPARAITNRRVRGGQPNGIEQNA